MAENNKQELRDPGGLWKWLRAFVAISALLSLVLGGSQIYEVLAGTPDIETDMLDPAVLAWIAVAGIAGIGFLLVFVICIVLTGRLTYRLMRNLHRLGSREAKIGPGWAVGWYFVPIANLWMPVRAVGEMWRGSHEMAGEPEKDSAIPLWWGSWIISNIMSNISWGMSERSYVEGVVTDPETYAMSLWLGAASNLLGALAALFMLMVFGPMVRLQSGIVRAHAFR